MKRSFVMTMGALLTFAPSHVDPYAQSVREGRVALTLGASGGDFGQVGAMAATYGVSLRLWSAKQHSGHLSASYASPWSSGATVCIEELCDMRRFRDEWRIGADVRRPLGTSALFAHVGLGVSWSRVTGVVSRDWGDWDKGDERTPLGLGRIGIGVRSRHARLGRWLEGGVERQAGAANELVYLRAGLGIL
jgi:hypothetical protein